MEFHPEAALPFALRALDLAQTEEEKAISHLTLGDRWTELGHFEKAFSHYFQALPYPEALKKWVATSLKLGQEHEKRKEWSEAVELYKNTLTQSSDVSLLLRLGLAELALDQLEDAKMHLKSFISNVDPSTSEAGPAYIALAQAHEKCQAYDEAIDCLSSYFHSFTSTGSGSKTEAGVHLAQLLNRLDRWDEAQRVLQGIQLNDDACVQWGIARGNGYWKEYLTHLQGPPKLFLEFLNQIEHQVQNKANV
ncbi:hypothetical protein HMI55_004567 [Coelomomyces lativittatus]|nr:hypothetical protein HMI55_004567 [Coelomomyces lativittatus]